ncbi:MAG: metalloprotease [Planctomycetaceae bacterium]
MDAETSFGPFLSATRGRFTLSLSALIPVAVAALVLAAVGLAGRYALLLATLLIHECAHGLVALGLGSGRACIAIWPIFGRALVQRLPGRREAWVALAGPAANLILAAGLALCGARFTLALLRAPLLDFAFMVNLGMGAGNLVPISPIDGGRALAALLRPRA